MEVLNELAIRAVALDDIKRELKEAGIKITKKNSFIPAYILGSLYNKQTF